MNVTLAMRYVCLCCFQNDIDILRVLCQPKIDTLTTAPPSLPAFMGARPGQHDCLRSVSAANVLSYYGAWYLPFHIISHYIYGTLGSGPKKAV